MFRTIVIILISLISLSLQAAVYEGGTGIIGDPFQIATPEQMNTIGLNPDDWDDHFILTADIDMSAYTGMQYNIIGTDQTPFTGVFDGNGHVIENFTCTIEVGASVFRVGLFGCTSNATISDLGLTNAAITVNGGYSVGVLIGENAAGSTITGCYTTGSVRGYMAVGGLIGTNRGGSIVSCYSACSVECYATQAGGLVGYNENAIVDKNFTAGSVNGSGYLGGVVGANKGTITSCYSTASIGVVYGFGANQYYGGLVGTNDGSISNCYATGNVNGATRAAGLAGQNDLGSISYCYAAGHVTGTQFYAGFIGEQGSGSLTACFWNTETSGCADGVANINPDPSGVSGKTTFQMKTPSTFVGWDFSATDGDPADWKIQAGVDYPRVQWQLINPAPVATPVAMTVTDTNERQIALTAADDGLPGPLHYIITALPEHGTLTDPGFGPIMAVPYRLLNGLHAVNYLPCVYAHGQDEFAFLANDTGYAPNGGNSNEAAVTITFDYDLAVGQQTSVFSEYPLYTNRADCRLQIIYTTGEFGPASVITGLDFYVKKIPAKALTNFTIRMQQTDMSVYPSEPNFINSGWTTVYRGNATISSTGVRRFDFQTPFQYDGLQNVLVDISFDNATRGFSNGEVWTMNATGRTIYQVSLGEHGDPLLWTRSMFGTVLTASSAPLVLELHRQSAVAPIVSDFNIDCSVGAIDLEAMASVWLSQQGDGVYSAVYDISTPADQIINLADFAVFASEWMSGPYDEPDYSPYDFSHNTDVDLPDLLMLTGAWLTQEGQAGYDEVFDLADDQKIDLGDFAVFTQHWMETL